MLSWGERRGDLLKQKERRSKSGITLSLEFSLLEKLEILFCKNVTIYIDFNTDTNGKYLESYSMLQTNKDI